MTRAGMLQEIEIARRMLARARAQYPNFSPLADMEEALNTLRSKVQARWPLTDDDERSVEIGQFAVRNFDDIDHDLVMQLVRVGRLAKEAGSERGLRPSERTARAASSGLLADVVLLALAVVPWLLPGPSLEWRLGVVLLVTSLWLLGRRLYRESLAPIVAVAVLSAFARILCWKIMGAMTAVR